MKRRWDQHTQMRTDEQAGAPGDALSASYNAFDPAHPPSDYTGKEVFSPQHPVKAVWHQKHQVRSSEQDDYPGAALKDAYTDI